MKRIFASSLLMLITFVSLFSQVCKGDSPFYEQFRTLPLAERENLAVREILSGNIPVYNKGFAVVRSVEYDAVGQRHTIKLYVKRDYLTIGELKSLFIVPLSPYTAQTIADSLDCSLPTSKISDLIFKKARIRPEPFNFIPRGNRNETPDVFYDHSRVIFAQIKASGRKPGKLTAGTKKDVVISQTLSDTSRTRNVVIYGWHRGDGSVIQPEYNGHSGNYVDYSHGIRLIYNKMILDGKERDIRDILRDSVLYKVLSYGNRPLEKVSYH